MTLIALATACSPQSESDTPQTAKTAVVGPDIAHPAILVFSKTLEWRHNEGIAGADQYFVRLGRKLNMSVFTTVDSSVFNEDDLKRFELVIFNNPTGNM